MVLEHLLCILHGLLELLVVIKVLIESSVVG